MPNQQSTGADLEKARETIQRLSPDRLCLGKLLDLRSAAPDVIREVISAITNALLGGGLVKIVSAGIEALAGRSLGQLLMKWGIARNETVECLKNIVNTAKEASQYIDDEGLRDVVEEVASKWGWDVETFKHFVKTAAGKSITEDEVKKTIEEALKKIEKELREVRERVRGLPAGVEVFFINDFEDGLAYPTVRLDNGELMILGEYGYHEIVRTGSFSTLTNEVKQRLGAGSLVVLTGPKGVGKSTLATVTIWNLLKSGEVGMVLRIRELPDGEVVESFRSFIENFLVRDWEYFGNLIILYDPTGVYRQVGGVEAPSKLETTVRNVLEAVRRAVENARSILGREPSARVGVLIILPTDLYNALSNDVRGKLESYRLDAPLNDVEFLAGLIREYTRTSDKPSGCKISDEELSKLAGKVAGFDSGHALIARFIGEELARSNCDVGKIEELISNAKDRAEAFIIQYINKLFKVDEASDTTKEAIVKVFALRRPFVSWVRPGEPILTPGVIELIGEKREAKLLYSAVGEELRGWLAIRQHDLIEGAIEELLDCIEGKGEGCEELGDALKPWKTIGVIETLREVSEKIRDVDSAVDYFVGHYGKEFTNRLRILSDISDNYWKKAALIIGYALAGPSLVLRLEDLLKGLPGDVIEFLDYDSRRYEIDDFLLVDNEIPSLITSLVLNNAYVLTEAFVDKYKEAVNEINKILNKVRDKDKGIIYDAEAFYGLGLALIIANAAESGKPVESNDADAALYIVSFVIQHVVSPDLIPDLIVPILNTLWPLRGKAPQRYIELLALELLVLTSDIEILDLAMVRYILGELNEILDNYGDVVRGYAWSLVHAIRAYANLLRGYLIYISDEVEGAVRRVTDLLNELGRFKTSLGVIAWAYALDPALIHENVRGFMEKALGIDATSKANEVLEELSRLRKGVQELISDEEFRSYVESMYIKTDEKAVKKVILEAASHLKHALAIYRLYNDELDEAKKLSNEAAEEYREIGDYENYLITRGWALRAEAIKGSLVGDELVKKFQRLYEETFNEEYFMPTALYLSFAPGILGEYLVSLALTGDHETINELLEEHWLVLRINEQVSVLTRLMINALLRPKDRKDQLGSELKDKLGIDSRELINAFGSDIYMYIEFLPALRVALGITRPKDETAVCMLIKDSTKRMDCMYAISVAMNDNAAVVQLRGWLINRFRGLLFEKLGLLKELGANADALLNEFMGLVDGLDGKSLAQLLAPTNSIARLALMLYALVNGNEKLAKAHALMGTTDLIRESEFISWFWFTSMIISKSKLLTRLLLETYRECCDLGSEEFRRAIAKLFFLHV